MPYSLISVAVDANDVFTKVHDEAFVLSGALDSPELRANGVVEAAQIKCGLSNRKLLLLRLESEPDAVGITVAESHGTTVMDLIKVPRESLTAASVLKVMETHFLTSRPA